MNERHTRLTSVPMFAHLPEGTVERIAALLVERAYPTGAEVDQQGERGVAFFVMVCGSAAVIRGTGPGDEGRLHAGDCFGEMALLDDEPRSVTVRTLEPSVCLVLPRWDFLAELKSDPQMAVDLLRVLNRRLRAAERRLEELESARVPSNERGVSPCPNVV